MSDHGKRNYIVADVDINKATFYFLAVAKQKLQQHQQQQQKHNFNAKR